MSILASVWEFLAHRPSDRPPRPQFDTLRERERAAEKRADEELFKLRVARMRYDTRTTGASKLHSMLDAQDQMVEEALGRREPKAKR